MTDPYVMVLVLVMGALMGMMGQGARAVIGLKGMTDDAKSLDLDPSQLFQAARLVTSLLIGMFVGLAAALVFIANATSSTTMDWHTLVGFASAGYLGTDFLEGFISKYISAPKAIRTELALQTASLRVAAARKPKTAKQLVYLVLSEIRPHNPFDDDTALADLAFDDGPSKDVLAQEINRRNWNGVYLGFGALSGCSKVKDVTKVVEKATGSEA